MATGKRQVGDGKKPVPPQRDEEDDDATFLSSIPALGRKAAESNTALTGALNRLLLLLSQYVKEKGEDASLVAQLRVRIR